MEKALPSIVDHLIKICNERTEGYKKAATTNTASTLKTLFQSYAQQSFQFRQELLNFSNKKSAYTISTSLSSDSWRLWTVFKSAVTNGGIKSVLEACVIGENTTIRNYKEILGSSDLPQNIRSIVQRQLSQIHNAYNVIGEIAKKVD